MDADGELRLLLLLLLGAPDTFIVECLAVRVWRADYAAVVGHRRLPLLKMVDGVLQFGGVEGFAFESRQLLVGLWLAVVQRRDDLLDVPGLRR